MKTVIAVGSLTELGGEDDQPLGHSPSYIWIGKHNWALVEVRNYGSLFFNRMI